MNLPALLFVGFEGTLRDWERGLLLFVQFHQLLPFGGAGRVFDIQLGRLLGRTALPIQTGDKNIPGILILGDADAIAEPNIPAGLAALAVDMHLSAADRVGRQAAGLEKPCGP